MIELITKAFGAAAQKEVVEKLAFFALAAWIYSKKMNQLTESLTKGLASLSLRVDKIEEHLKIKGE